MAQDQTSARIAQFLTWTPQQQQMCIDIHNILNKPLVTPEPVAQSTQNAQSLLANYPKHLTSVNSTYTKIKSERLDRWTQEDDLEILAAIEEHGATASTFRMLAPKLLRTDKAVASRWHMHLKSKMGK